MIFDKDIEYYLDCLEYPDLVESAMEQILNFYIDEIDIALSILCYKSDNGDLQYRTWYLLYNIKAQYQRNYNYSLSLLDKLFEQSDTPDNVLKFLDYSFSYAKYIVNKIQNSYPLWVESLLVSLDQLCSKKNQDYDFYSGLRKKILAAKMYNELRKSIDSGELDSWKTILAVIPISSVLKN